jgi:hypothetical protein
MASIERVKKRLDEATLLLNTRNKKSLLAREKCQRCGHFTMNGSRRLRRKGCQRRECLDKAAG